MNIRNRVKEMRLVNPDEVAPNPRNWRSHPQAQRDAIRGILADVGIAGAVLAYESKRYSGLTLIDGHERMTVGVAFPALILDVSDEEADKLLATFDPISAMAETNATALDSLLRDVSTDNAALAQMLNDLATDAGLYIEPQRDLVEDEIPEPPADPITKPGDLWLLGDHRLLCGDSTKAEDVDRLMAGAKADLCFTDPPYGVSVVPSSGKIGGGKLAKNRTYHPVHGDDVPFSADHLWSMASSFVIWGANYFPSGLPHRGQWVVWDKGRPEGTTFSDAELAWTDGDGVAVKMYRCVWNGMTRQGESGERYHPTQKPIKLTADVLGDFAGTLVVDPYLGSGTTLIAAEQLGRKCYGMEISPAYCDVIVKRWETLTGKKAIRQTIGEL